MTSSLCFYVFLFYLLYVLSIRSVFVVGLNEQLLGAAVRLEAALHELAQNYYHTHIKNVRAQKVKILLERVLERNAHSWPLRGIFGFIPCFGSGFYQVSGSRLGNRIRIHEDKNDPQKVKKFYVFKCWMFSFES
jgi:hypothetical protein